MRSAEGNLHFFVNGVDQGQAASHIPPSVYAVIDLYGKCAQVTVTEPDLLESRDYDDECK